MQSAMRHLWTGFLAALLSLSVALASPASAQGADTSGPGRVVLKDGGEIAGMILSQQAGQFVVIKTLEGAVRTLAWDLIREVVVYPSNAATPASHQAMPAYVAPAADTRQHTSVDPASRGSGFTLTTETVTRRAEPRSGSSNFSADFSSMYGYGDGFSMTALGVGLGMKNLFGDQFPGDEGGSWNGFALDLNLNLSYAVVSIEVPTEVFQDETSTETNEESVLVTGANVAFGWQFLAFGALDERTLEQGGFGVALKYRFGLTKVSDQDGQFTHGPSLDLTFPKYNVGTADFSSSYLSFLVLPTENFTIISVAFGGAF